ncbi:Holliday junction resolvase RuvX [soil metagenome]
MGIDYGEKRIGVALSDPTGSLASPLTTLVRRRGKRPPYAEIARLADEREVAEIVVGLPLDLAGDEGEWCAEVRRFGEKLAARTGLPLHWIDERLSSVRAERAIRGAGLPKQRREEKERVDAAAAAVILQLFLATRAAARRATDDAVE